MKIKELEKLRRLKATPKIMRMAAADVPRREKQHGWERIIYTNGMYMRCHIQDGYLVVAMFLSEHLRAGARKPAYELFIHSERREFITYDSREDKWRNATLYRLCWPSYFVYSGQWISTSDDDKIKTYLNGKRGGYYGLTDFQDDIRDEELKKRHKKETDPWDLDLAQTPDLPKDWHLWVNKVGIPQNYIYYHYNKKGVDTGYCTYCERDVPIKQPRHNKEGRCPRCRRKITFKSVGKAGAVITERATMYLIQRCRDGLVIREFIGKREYAKGGYKLPKQILHEVRRAIFDKDATPLRAYYMGLYKQSEHRWIQCGNCSSKYPGDEKGRVYGRTLPNLFKSELRQTGLMETFRHFGQLDPEKYLAVLSDAPYLERLAKAELPRMVYECVSKSWRFDDGIQDKNATSLTKMFGISTQALKRLRKNGGGVQFMEWLRYEREAGKAMPDDIIWWYCKERLTPSGIKFISDRMSAVQICNYIRRQMQENNTSSRDILTTWADYLSMAARLKMDVKDAIVYRVNKLYKRHDELVELCNQKSFEEEVERIQGSFPQVNAICASLKEKYEYSGEDYVIIVPSNVRDILLEGRELHHCVDKSDRYWERIEHREAYIMFLRKASEPEKPYYTLEVEPNGTVRQKRTMYNRQNPDIKEAMKFLSEWQRSVSERLDADDLELAKTSRDLRDQEYTKLREDKAIIHTGDLAGRLLVDVLLADLMENTALPKAA